ncbi:MAG TPA: chemotaxis protein CheD [Longimicrobiales bacterium]
MTKGTLHVRPGDVEVAGAGTVLATLGLGSCVAVALHDPGSELGALCHAMLPAPLPGRSAVSVGRFASLVVPAQVEKLESAGADRSRLRAWLVGGATMFSIFAGDQESVGSRNVRAARAALESLGIPVVAEDVGGTYGRSVYFTVGEGTIEVRSVQNRKIVL